MDYSPFISGTELRLVAPMIIVATTAIAVLLLQVFHRSQASRKYLAWISSLGLAVAGIDSVYLLGRGADHVVFSGMLHIDGFSLVINLLIVIAGILSCLASPAYLASHRLDRGEYYGLILFSIVGMMTMGASGDLFTVFMGVEMMSIPIYCLAAFFRHSARSAESGMKYFILGSFSSAFLLYGIALIYGLTGTTNLEAIRGAMRTGAFFVEGDPVATLATLPALALVLILVAFAFKIAAVPFHMWTPDVYEGAPTAAVSFMSTAVKTAGFAALVRVFVVGFFDAPARVSDTGWLIVFFWLAVLSMALGNVVAIVQTNVKRMLAYSSIAHAGYLLVGFTAASHSAESFLNMESVLFYLLSYTFATVGAFAVLAYFGKRGEECTTYDDLAGIGTRYPGASLAMAIFMFSSAGIPPTAGFIAKFYVFRAAIMTGSTEFLVLAVVGVLLSLAGVYYYLKLVVSMYMKPARREVVAIGGVEIKMALVVCAVATLYLGIFPAVGLDLARTGVQGIHGAPPAIQSAVRPPVDVAAKLDLEP
jgi:NADH-quinone oxidoreductase subunit N